MQFLESSVIGLRAARHRLTSPDHAAEVTLFPMVHVGEPAFFQKVYAEAGAHDIVLLEGVTSKTASNLTRAYRWMRVGRLGLVVQPAFDTAETTAEVIRADLSAEEFDALWQAIPVLERRLLAGLAPIFGVLRGLILSRRSLARNMNQEDLTTRDDLLIWGTPFTGHRRVLLEARDARLCSWVESVLQRSAKRPLRVAIVYGAAHMPQVLHCLRQGWRYVVVDSDWMTVFSER